MERIPDYHVHCFRDFRHWLSTQPDFARKTDVSQAHMGPTAVDVTSDEHLDALALSAPGDQQQTYDVVRDLWRTQCLKEPQPVEHPQDTMPGSTDGSLDVMHLLDLQLDVERHTNIAEIDRGRFNPRPGGEIGWTKRASATDL